MSSLNEVLSELEALAEPEKAKGLAHYGIPEENALGIRMPVLRKLAREIGKDQALAEELWQHRYHECKLLATLVAEPKRFSLADADCWVNDIYSWDVCDQLCINLLRETEYAWELPQRWAPEEQEFIRRAGIVMIAVMGVHFKKTPEEDFLQFVPLLKTYATDERNFVKKAVNWAIRQLGKRSAFLHPHMISLCHELLEMDSKAASWSARDALRELESEKIKFRLQV